MLTNNDVARFWSKVKKTDDEKDCWNWIASSGSQGYGQFRLGLRVVRATHIAWELAFGKIPDALWILHTCDNPSCCNPSHLFLGTNQDNVDDREQKGRNVVLRGEEHANHKLSDAQVFEIRQRYSLGPASQRDLSKVFGVSQKQIGRIVNYKQRT